MLSLLYLFFREDNIVDFSELLEGCVMVLVLLRLPTSYHLCMLLRCGVAVLCVGESLKVIHMMQNFPPPCSR